MSRQLTLRIEGYGGAYFATLKAPNGSCWPVIADDGGRAFATPTEAFQRGLETAKVIPGGFTVGPVIWPDEGAVNSNTSCLIILLVCLVIGAVVSCL